MRNRVDIFDDQSIQILSKAINDSITNSHNGSSDTLLVNHEKNLGMCVMGNNSTEQEEFSSAESISDNGTESEDFEAFDLQE